MTTGFGFCPNCGTPRIAAEQKFCAGCGAALSPVAPAALMAAPPAPPAPVAAPPAPPSAVQAPAPPPAWAAAQPPVAAPPMAAARPPVAAPPQYSPAPSAGQTAPKAAAVPIATVMGVNITRQMLLIGGIVLAVVVGAFIFMNMNSKPGSLSVTPSTFSCSSSVQVTSTIKLPKSLKATDQLLWQLDGVTSIKSTVGDNFTAQGDGSWMFTNTSSASSSCSGPNGELAMGTHTMRILDAGGRVLAEGAYTLKP